MVGHTHAHLLLFRGATDMYGFCQRWNYIFLSPTTTISDSNGSSRVIAVVVVIGIVVVVTAPTGDTCERGGWNEGERERRPSVHFLFRRCLCWAPCQSGQVPLLKV